MHYNTARCGIFWWTYKLYECFCY